VQATKIVGSKRPTNEWKGGWGGGGERVEEREGGRKKE
jgi:hypothetical protein